MKLGHRPSLPSQCGVTRRRSRGAEAPVQGMGYILRISRASASGASASAPRYYSRRPFASSRLDNDRR
jgi:hypothetical protein